MPFKRGQRLAGRNRPICAVWSILAVTSRDPSGEMARSYTPPVCFAKVCSHLPVPTFHSRSAESSAACQTLAVGRKSKCHDRARVALKYLSDLSGRQLDEVDRIPASF